MNKASIHPDSLQALTNAEFAARLLLYLNEASRVHQTQYDVTTEELASLLEIFNSKEPGFVTPINQRAK
jgi:hypothetical protein